MKEIFAAALLLISSLLLMAILDGMKSLKAYSQKRKLPEKL